MLHHETPDGKLQKSKRSQINRQDLLSSDYELLLVRLLQRHK